MIAILGIIGGAAFALAALPQALLTVKTGVDSPTPSSVITAILVGVACMYIYLLVTTGFDWIIFINYLVEGSTWLVLAGYRIRAILVERARFRRWFRDPPGNFSS